MTCWYPLGASRGPQLTKTGKKVVKVLKREDWLGKYTPELMLPCGQCTGCRLDHANMWSLRIMHEATEHAQNSFITLTYSDDFVPDGGSLVVGDFQRFMKRLRRSLDKRIKFFHCGEYGDQYGRPHFHAAIFGHDFEGKTLWKRNAKGDPLYTSEELSDLWSHPPSGLPYGHCLVGALTRQSASYVARYTLKKVTGDAAWDRYSTISDDGTVMMRSPEYTTMSNGIGEGWINQYLNDVFPHDFVEHQGRKFPVPRYYDGQYEIAYPSDYENLKERRVERAEQHAWNQTDPRLEVRQKVQEARLRLVKRGDPK